MEVFYMNVVFRFFLTLSATLGTLYVTILYRPMLYHFLSKKSSHRNRPIGIVILIFFVSMIGGMLYSALLYSP